MDLIQRDHERIKKLGDEMANLENTLEMIKKKMFSELMNLDTKKATPADRFGHKQRKAVK